MKDLKSIKMVFLLLSLFIGQVHAERIGNVLNTEYDNPSMLGRYDDFGHSEVLVATFPKDDALNLVAVVQSKTNYSATYLFELGTISSLDAVNALGDGEYEILVGIDGVNESEIIHLDASETIKDIYSALTSRDPKSVRMSISIEREKVEKEELKKTE